MALRTGLGLRHRTRRQRCLINELIRGLCSSLHVQIRMMEEKPLAKAIQPVAVGRESQNKGLIVANQSGECDRLSIHPAGEAAVGLRLTCTGVPRAGNG